MTTKIKRENGDEWDNGFVWGHWHGGAFRDFIDCKCGVSKDGRQENQGRTNAGV
jgi:hypothetical protein